MATCNPASLLASSTGIANLNSKEALTVIAALLCRIYQALDPMATCDVNTLVADAQCFACLPQNQIWMLMAQLLCNIEDKIGGGGIGNVFCGTSDPTTDPGVSCAFYYRSDNGAVWFWKDSATAWVQLITA